MPSTPHSGPTLAVPVADVERVLLTDGRWYAVSPGTLAFGQVEVGGANGQNWAPGFWFTTNRGERICGPISLLVSVRGKQ